MAGTHIIKSAGLSGISGFDVVVEVSITNGLPGFVIVGLPDNSVKESRERVRAAIKNIGLEFPMRRILVNLAPADTKKEGPIYDLPIAIGLLAASEQIGPVSEKSVFVGELSLDGFLRPVTGVLPMSLSACAGGADSLFIPEDSALEASIAEGLNVYPARHICDIIAHLRGEKPIEPAPPYKFDARENAGADFSEVRGQSAVKRAIEVAVGGAHNILLTGVAGGGKSMMARRIPSILPPMSMREMIESTAIHSAAGLTSKSAPLLTQRPFRAPHHTVSASGAAGGGRSPKPGEISLAHNGVLFLDEFPEFHRDVLETLRQPLEDGAITITRAAWTCTFPSRFMLVCAMNPCKCGWYGHPSGKCRCSEESVQSYARRISGPILDRIDIFAETPSLLYGDLAVASNGEPSAEIRRRVTAAQALQLDRQGTQNAHMTGAQIAEHCALDAECSKLMRVAYEKFSLSARAYNRILKVARTIADLAENPRIAAPHLAEAIRYRSSGLLDT
ncbi:MAG: YifB family Mg chelatase-like AAA ATPase [Clostridiales Family XIII bacterium]|jgi:magnesium chelatase family protein|nr:YifB family Mg chelatase-like AAA ATPase [Clostridiales Family XIII bacterium]